MSTEPTPEDIQSDRIAVADELTAGSAEVADVDGEGFEAPPPPSETVLDLDDWSKRRGEEIFEQSEALQHILKDMKRSDAEYATADFFFSAFEDEPEIAANPTDKLRAEFMEKMTQTTTFRELQADTLYDDVASSIAAESFAVQYVEVVEERKTPQEAAGDAMKGASEGIEDARNIEDAFGGGIGGEGGDPNGRTRIRKVAALMKKAKASHMLQKVAQYAGRYRRAAQSFQRMKVTHGQDEMVGVTSGGDIEHLVPGELSLLAECEELAFLRIIERTAIVRDFRGIESVAKGPIVVVVDESGSMGCDDNIYKAKAIALAMYWVAKSQNRYVCLVGFSNGTAGTYLPIGPTENKQEDVLEWCEHFYSGGTTCDVPLVEVPRKWDELGCPQGKTDMIIITDAQVRVPDTMKADFNMWRERETCKVHTIVIGDQAGDLAEVSDHVHEVTSLELDNGAMDEVMSV